MSISNSSRICLVFAGLLAVVVGLNIAVPALDGRDEAPDTRLRDFHAVAGRTEILSLGSSHSVGLDFTAMGLRGYSFHSPGMGLHASLLKLRVLLPRMPALRTVVVPVGPGVFSVDRRTVSGRVLARQLAHVPGPGLAMLVQDPQTIPVAVARWRNAFYRLAGGNAATGALLRQGLGGVPMFGAARCLPVIDPRQPDRDGLRHGFRQNPVPGACLPRSLDRSVRAQLRTLSAITRPLATVQDENIADARTMARLLRDRPGGRLILVRMPYTREYFHSAMHPYLESDADIARTLAAQDPGIGFIDLHDALWTRDYLKENDVFYDNHHITATGAQRIAPLFRAALDAAGRR